MKYVIINKLNEVVEGVLEASSLPVFEAENTLRPVEVRSYPSMVTVKGQIYTEEFKAVEDTKKSLANKEVLLSLRDSDYRVIRALENKFLKGTLISQDRQALRDLMK